MKCPRPYYLCVETAILFQPMMGFERPVTASAVLWFHAYCYHCDCMPHSKTRIRLVQNTVNLSASFRLSGTWRMQPQTPLYDHISVAMESWQVLSKIWQCISTLCASCRQLPTAASSFALSSCYLLAYQKVIRIPPVSLLSSAMNTQHSSPRNQPCPLLAVNTAILFIFDVFLQFK